MITEPQSISKQEKIIQKKESYEMSHDNAYYKSE